MREEEDSEFYQIETGSKPESEERLNHMLTLQDILNNGENHISLVKYKTAVQKSIGLTNSLPVIPENAWIPNCPVFQDKSEKWNQNCKGELQISLQMKYGFAWWFVIVITTCNEKRKKLGCSPKWTISRRSHEKILFYYIQCTTFKRRKYIFDFSFRIFWSLVTWLNRIGCHWYYKWSQYTLSIVYNFYKTNVGLLSCCMQQNAH